MFCIQRVRDVVEVEPAYFPVPLVAGGALTTGTPSAASAVPIEATNPPAAAPPLNGHNNKSPANNHNNASSSISTSSGKGLPLEAPYVPTFVDLVWHRLSEKYVGRVLPHVGLCVAIAAVDATGASAIRGGDGAAWCTVVFQCVVFRPELGTRLTGKIAAQDESGLMLDLGFFAVHIPGNRLIPGSRFDPSKIMAATTMTTTNSSGGASSSTTTSTASAAPAGAAFVPSRGAWYVPLAAEDSNDDPNTSATTAGGGGGTDGEDENNTQATNPSRRSRQQQQQEQRNYYENGDEAMAAVESVFVRGPGDVAVLDRLLPMEVIASFATAGGLGPLKWY